MIRRTLAAGVRASEVAAKVQGRVLKALDTPFLSRRLGDWPGDAPAGVWEHGRRLRPHRRLAWESAEATSLKLLSFNIQLGIRTSRYRQYVTKGWKHLLPHSRQAGNLERIARVVAGYDLVALQEIDGGSLRSGFVNQVEYLASKAGFPLLVRPAQPRSRPLGAARQRPLGQGAALGVGGSQTARRHHSPGRGAIVVRVRCRGKGILVVLLHLSLGGRARHLQLAYVRELIRGEAHAVVMGDMNSHLSRLLFRSPLAESPLAPCSAAAAHLAGLAASVGAGPCVGYAGH